MPHKSPEVQSCIEACVRCAEECEHCAIACLNEPDPKPMARCIALDIDCAKICWDAAAYMCRGSEFMNQVCHLCATICDACGAECEKHQHIEHCRACAEACRRCAEACRRMAGAA